MASILIQKGVDDKALCLPCCLFLCMLKFCGTYSRQVIGLLRTTSELKGQGEGKGEGPENALQRKNRRNAKESEKEDDETRQQSAEKEHGLFCLLQHALAFHICSLSFSPFSFPSIILYFFVHLCDFTSFLQSLFFFPFSFLSFLFAAASLAHSSIFYHALPVLIVCLSQCTSRY